MMEFNGDSEMDDCRTNTSPPKMGDSDDNDDNFRSDIDVFEDSATVIANSRAEPSSEDDTNYSDPEEEEAVKFGPSWFKNHRALSQVWGNLVNKSTHVSLDEIRSELAGLEKADALQLRFRRMGIADFQSQVDALQKKQNKRNAKDQDYNSLYERIHRGRAWNTESASRISKDRESSCEEFVTALVKEHRLLIEEDLVKIRKELDMAINVSVAFNVRNNHLC